MLIINVGILLFSKIIYQSCTGYMKLKEFWKVVDDWECEDWENIETGSPGAGYLELEDYYFVQIAETQKERVTARRQ